MALRLPSLYLWCSPLSATSTTSSTSISSLSRWCSRLPLSFVGLTTHQRGITVKRFTFAELQHAASVVDGKLVVNGQEVGLVYYRAGYTPDDYHRFVSATFCTHTHTSHTHFLSLSLISLSLSSLNIPPAKRTGRCAR